MANTTGNKFGGRKKGTPNKQTKEIREAYKLLIENNLSNVEIWIKKVAENNPEKAIDIIIKLSEYVIPKLQRTELKGGLAINSINEMTPEERDARILELKKKLNKA